MLTVGSQKGDDAYFARYTCPLCVSSLCLDELLDVCWRVLGGVVWAWQRCGSDEPERHDAGPDRAGVRFGVGRRVVRRSATHFGAARFDPHSENAGRLQLGVCRLSAVVPAAGD